MNLSIPGPSHIAEDLLVLRREIARHADRCGLQLTDRWAVSRFLDGNFSNGNTSTRNDQDCQDLRAMLILLLPLETSSSEDLGSEGLRRLWQQHSEILARFHVHEPLPSGLPSQYRAS